MLFRGQAWWLGFGVSKGTSSNARF